MEEGLVLLNPSKYKRRRALLHRVIAEQQSKREQTHPVCSCAVENMKRWRALTCRMITKQQVKNEQIKRKQTCSLCFVNVFQKQVQDCSKEFLRNKFNINKKKVFWKSHWSQ